MEDVEYNAEDVLDLSDNSNVVDVEIEEVDDTPAEDRNRTALPDNIVDELENDDLSDYSDKVKQRIAQLKKVWHDERRAKEAADRERTEAIRFASSIIEQNKNLKNNLVYGEQAYAQTLQHATGGELEAAKRAYKDAYDSGDTDQITEAQIRLNAAQMHKMRADSYIPQYNNDPPEVPQPAQQQVQHQQQVQPPAPDNKALAWHTKNQWFGKDVEMTGWARGLHQQLVNEEGIDPTSDEYYQEIDKAVRRRFPEEFKNKARPVQRRTGGSVVASASRSTAPRTVRLSSSQLSIARKFGLTPEQYAREQIKLENA